MIVRYLPYDFAGLGTVIATRVSDSTKLYMVCEIYSDPILQPNVTNLTKKVKNGLRARLPEYCMFVTFKKQWDCHVI